MPNTNYNVSDVKLTYYIFKKITTLVDGKELIIYVFDHQKHDTLNILF